MTETPQTTRCRVRINVTGQGQHQCEEPAVEGGYCAKHQSAFSRHLIPPVPAPSAPARAGETPTFEEAAIKAFAEYAARGPEVHPEQLGYPQGLQSLGKAYLALLESRALAPATAENQSANHHAYRVELFTRVSQCPVLTERR